MTKQQAMGLYSPPPSEHLTLGTRVIAVTFTSFKSFPVVKNSIMASVTSLPTMSPLFLKNKLE